MLHIFQANIQILNVKVANTCTRWRRIDVTHRVNMEMMFIRIASVAIDTSIITIQIFEYIVHKRTPIDHVHHLALEPVQIVIAFNVAMSSFHVDGDASYNEFYVDANLISICN